MSIWLSKDNHDSWGTCATSVECKTIITTMLTVMSDIDPHMISGIWDGLLVKSLVGLCRSEFTRLWIDHGETPWHDRDCYICGDEFATLLLEYLWHSC
jgi:hypothetical protein